jgi:hypothetical protein
VERGEPTPTRRRTTVAEAAEILGISAEAVRGRIRRGTLPVERGGGKVYVLLNFAEGDRTTADQSRTTADQPADHTDLLIAALREQLAQANERDRENRRIIAALTQRIPAIEAPAEASPETPGEPPETTEQLGRMEPQQAVRGAPEGAERHGRRSWWREFFGFGE